MHFKNIFAILLLLVFTACGDDGDTSMEPDTPFPSPLEMEEDVVPEYCPTTDAKALYDLMMAYRADNGLDPIPLSLSLTEVAQKHARDLDNHFETSNSTECNTHTWSDQGDWTSCCYKPDHSDPHCMWDKPRELTDYTGDGFEIVSWGFTDMEAALGAWRNSPPHNDVVLNAGPNWTNDWNAVGIGVEGFYASAWFGTAVDPAVGAEDCPD